MAVTIKRAMVTGAPGFLGAWICRLLVERGVEVKGLALPGEDLSLIEDLPVEIVYGDVRDPERMKEVMTGIDTVFHLAAIYDGGHDVQARMYDVNLRGTFHVLSACRSNRVRRVVYTASIVSLGRSKNSELIDETAEYDAWDLDFPYSRSKLFSRWIASDFASWGLDVRVVAPGIVLGPGDIRPTPSGRLIRAISNNMIPAHAGGGASYVDVRDAALAHILAAEKGYKGGTWAATAHNLSTREFMTRVARVVGARAFFPKVPKLAAMSYVGGIELAAKLRGKEPDVTRNFIDYGSIESYFDNSKSRDELGVTYRPFEETIADAAEWFRAKGMM